MKKGILMKRISRKNLKNITDEMNINVNKYKSKNGDIYPFAEELDVLIRWGCTSYLSSKITYNNRNAIRNASNKLKARKILKENNIDIPKTWTNIDNCEFPLIARPKYHYGAKNFYYCENLYELKRAVAKGAEYFSEFYPKTREFRIHACHGKILICCEKFVEDKSRKAWNLRKGGGEWKALRWSNIPSNIAKLSIDAVQALGLDYGAVDILAEPNKDGYKDAVVCEVNTAPRLGEYSASRYAEYFDWLLKSDEKKEHVSAEYDIGWRGYVWSHEDLE